MRLSILLAALPVALATVVTKRDEPAPLHISGAPGARLIANKYMVKFKEDADMKMVENAMGKLKTNADHTFLDVFKGFAARLEQKEVDALRNLPAVCCYLNCYMINFLCTLILIGPLFRSITLSRIAEYQQIHMLPRNFPKAILNGLSLTCRPGNPVMIHMSIILALEKALVPMSLTVALMINTRYSHPFDKALLKPIELIILFI